MSNRGNNWTADELKILIQLWTESSIMEIFDKQKKNGKAYEKLAQQLTARGFTRSKQQVESKVKGLRQSYHRARDAVEKSGASPDVVYEVCQHYDDLHAFLGKSPAARPHFLASSLDSDKTETDTPDEGSEQQESEQQERELQEPVDAAVTEANASDNSDEADTVFTPTGTRKRKFAIPGSDERRKRRTGDSDFARLVEKQSSESARSTRVLFQDCFSEIRLMSQEQSQSQQDLFKRQMEQDQQASQAMVGMMTQFMCALTGMQNPHGGMPQPYNPQLNQPVPHVQTAGIPHTSQMAYPTGARQWPVPGAVHQPVSSSQGTFSSTSRQWGPLPGASTSQVHPQHWTAPDGQKSHKKDM